MKNLEKMNLVLRELGICVQQNRNCQQYGVPSKKHEKEKTRHEIVNLTYQTFRKGSSNVITFKVFLIWK